MLRQNICRVQLTRHVMKLEDAGSNGFSNEVVGKRMVPLLQRRMWKGSVSANRTIVTKHVRRTMDGNSKVAKREAVGHHLLCGNLGGNKLRTICRSLNCSLLLGVPFKRSLVNEV